jgi:transketolase
MNASVVTKPHLENFVTWAADKPEVIVLSADLTNSCEINKFRDTFPERFFSVGMAEQNMLSFASGLAREGFEPWLHTFSVFLYRRSLDQLQLSVAYPNLPVRLVGFLPGITTPGGVSHQAIDDLNVLRGIPNMTILEMGDATEVESMLDVAHAIKGPVYIRMLRGEVLRIFPQSDPMIFNHARVLSQGTDVTILTSGIATEEALRSIPILQREGIKVNHLHVSTIKPFTDPQVLDALHSSKYGVITIENHSVIGGLGTCVAELISEHGIGKRLLKLGLQDTYSHGASQKYLLREHEMDAIALVASVESLMGLKLNISSDEIQATREIPMHSSAKSEAL